MKWMGITIFIAIVVLGWYVFLSSDKSPSEHIPRQRRNGHPALPQPITTVSSHLFIPYWNIPTSSQEVEGYDSLIYFGVAPDSNGKLMLDTGRLNLDTFMTGTDGAKQRLLTIRMLDDEVSLSILDSNGETRHARSVLIKESIQLAQEYDFDGVVLDLELGVIPFEDSKDRITSFVKAFNMAAKEAELSFSMTIYGDVFYRSRPYDVAALSDHVVSLYIMAYDFHKSRGEPGPNFPFDSSSTSPESLRASLYDYSFQQMIADFTSYIDKENITVVFGMYGYDWTLGKQGLPLKPAVAVPLNEIDATGAMVDPISKEKYVKYVDDEGYNHELWYEDIESANVKIDYLMEQGIGRVGYWVWGYY